MGVLYKKISKVIFFFYEILNIDRFRAKLVNFTPKNADLRYDLNVSGDLGPEFFLGTTRDPYEKIWIEKKIRYTR